MKQAIYHLGDVDPEFTADKVDNLMDTVTTKVHDAAATDLEQFLFNDNLSGSPAAAESSVDVIPDPVVH